MSDLMATGNAPGTQYIPSETNGVYHEDREVTVTGGPGSQMFRVYGAQFSYASGEWTLQTGAEAAYATVQNPDGSIHFFTSPPGMTTWSTSGWVGSGNNKVFNAVDYGFTAGGVAADNTAALVSAFADIATAGGGRLFIPAGSYPIDDTIAVPATDGMSNPIGIVIEGCGGSTEIAQQAATAVPIFSMTGSNNGSGVKLKNLRFSFENPVHGVFAIVSTTDEVVCEHCVFQNCPAMSMGGAHNGLLDCRVFYDVDDAADTENAVMIYMAHTNDFVDLCYIYQRSVSKTPPGPSGCIAIQVQGAEEPRVTNTNIVDFSIGIQILGNGGNPGNLTHGCFSNLACECDTNAVYIQPSGSGDTICELFFTGCVFERTHHSTSVSPGVYIDLYSGGGTEPDTVSDIFFTSCMVHDWAGPGIQINGGQDIVITGGRYGNDATSSTMTTSGAIAVTGPAVRVTIDGADCSATVPSYPAQPPADGAQPHSISVSGVVVSMQVRNCNLTNNGSAALHVSTTDADLQVTDCAGYNDQHVILRNSTPPTSASTFHSYDLTNPYWGPFEFYIAINGASVTAIYVDGTLTHLTSGSFYIAPGENAEIVWAGVGILNPTFLAIGK